MIQRPQMATATIQNLIVIIKRLWGRLPVSTGLLNVDRADGRGVLGRERDLGKVLDIVCSEETVVFGSTS